MIYTIAAFYRFTPVPDSQGLRAALLPECAALGLCGSLLIAPEGINGTLGGSAASIEALLNMLNAHVGLTRDEVKFSSSDLKPFNKLKIRLKREIVTLKQPAADPTKMVGTYVAPRDWNALLDQPDMIVLDTRNKYETLIGGFAAAQDPAIENFSEFVDYVRQNLDPARDKKIAMYCTGGIRCEKASAFMRAEGFAEVYHLKGGILKYLEEIPPEQSRWRGECYVFDRRVAVGHGLTTGRYGMCFNCGYPVNDADRADARFEEGVSCRHCFAATADADKDRFRMRQRNIAASPRDEARQGKEI